jgi:peptidyl-prolyl cis-trans isomerase C
MLRKLIYSTALSTLIICASATAATDDTIVAKVNGAPIYKKDLEKIEKTLPPELVKNAKEKDKDKFFAGLRDQAIDMKLLTAAAKKAGLEKDSEVQQAIAQMTEQVLLQAYIGKQLNPLVNDKTIRAKYEEFLKAFPKDEMETKARHIMVKDEAEAKKIIQELKGGADFQKLVREKSQDKSTAAEGGELGYMRKGDIDPKFAEALFSLKPGAYSETPVKTSLGWHIIKVEDRRKVKPPKFEEVKEQLGAAVFQEQFRKLVDQHRDKASIERFNADGKSVTSASDKGNTAPSSGEQKK